MPPSVLSKTSVAVPLGIAAVLLAAGVGGRLTVAWGYGLLLVATMLIFGGAAVCAIFMLTRRFDGEMLRGTIAWLFRLGGWAYVLAVAALAGVFVDETLRGQMEFKWILFGPAALAAIAFLDWGLYRLLIKNNLPTWRRYGHLISREQSDPDAMRQTLVDDVVLHRTLFSVSGFRWFKHTLIFWGFAAMFGIEVMAVFVREAVPAFGLPDVWRIHGHPLRLAFDVAFDATGLMVLVGCVLALAWRVVVNGTAEQKYTDTPTAAFLFLVVLSGFALESMRIAAAPPDPTHVASFVGYAFAAVIPRGLAESAAAYEGLWILHALGSCAFIAYVPVKRLIHSCATPMGRLMNSQKALLAAKKLASLQGLMTGKRL